MQRRTVLITMTLGTILFLSSLPFSRDNIVTSTPVQTYHAMVRAEASPALPVVERAARDIHRTQNSAAMIQFLTNHVARFPDDYANGYYLSIIGDIYYRDGAYELSRQYYRRALLRYPDVYVRKVPTHRVALNRLLEITTEPRERIIYLRHLREHYPDDTDQGLAAFHLGEAYAAAGRWPEAMESYRVFLSIPNTTIPGRPQANREIARAVALYDSNRQWTQRNLEDLVQMISWAIYNQNPAALLRHRSGHNFFTMSWQQDESDANSYIPTFDIGSFLRRSRVRFAANLEVSSNAREAYLRTWGWSHRIPTWYLYFRRVDFPSDPEVHGNWEWAGILFGEAF